MYNVRNTLKYHYCTYANFVNFKNKNVLRKYNTLIVNKLLKYTLALKYTPRSHKHGNTGFSSFHQTSGSLNRYRIFTFHKHSAGFS